MAVARKSLTSGKVVKGVYVPARARRLRLPVRIARVKTKVIKGARISRDVFTVVKDDIISSLVNVYSSPIVLISTCILFVFATNYLTTAALAPPKGNTAAGVTFEACTTYISNATRCTLFLKDGTKFVAPFLYFPAIFASPSSMRFLLSVLLSIWSTVVPESSVYQYLLQSALLSIYLRCKTKYTRFVLVIVAMAIYKLGFLVN